MRIRLLRALPILLLAVTAGSAAAQTALRLRWELVADSQAAFTLTNRGPKPLPATGWAIYFSALRSAHPGSVAAGFDIQDVLGHVSDKMAWHYAGEARNFAAASLMTEYSLAGQTNRFR